MIKTIFIFTSLFAFAPLFAGPALDSLTGASAGMPELRTAIPQDAAPSAAPVELGWYIYTSYVHGSHEFSCGEDQCSVSILFDRGVYDPYSRTYKAQPRIGMDSSYVGAPDSFPLSSTLNVQFLMSDDPYSEIGVARSGESLDVKELAVAPPVLLAYIPIKSLYEDWKLNSKAVRLQVEDKTFFLVGQMLFDSGTGVWRYGYVISENGVVNPITGVPQDFVELYRRNADGMVEHRTKAYSLALGLVFELRDVVGERPWTVRPMLESEVEEAVNDSLASGSEGRYVRRPTQALK
jgi:hypothetical protein